MSGGTPRLRVLEPTEKFPYKKYCELRGATPGFRVLQPTEKFPYKKKCELRGATPRFRVLEPNFFQFIFHYFQGGLGKKIRLSS
jgi:hypothetical protein